jgi:Asp-tRNA(Asn)/Glu-tRNA(Gln) amidotransferase C subunit
MTRLAVLSGFQKQADQLKIFVKKMTMIIKMVSQLQLNSDYKLNHQDQLRTDMNQVEGH